MALFKIPIDYRSQYNNLSTDELAVISNNQTGAHDARAVQTAREILQERQVNEQVARYQSANNQPFRPGAPPQPKRKFNWTWVVVLYLLFQLIRLIVKEYNK
jgi:hypothetical protein